MIKNILRQYRCILTGGYYIYGKILLQDMNGKKHGQTDKIIFFICLITSIGLSVGGFLTPPRGVIDGSVLTAVGLLLGFAALAVGAQAVANGNTARFTKGDVEVSIGEDE